MKEFTAEDAKVAEEIHNRNLRNNFLQVFSAILRALCGEKFAEKVGSLASLRDCRKIKTPGSPSTASAHPDFPAR